MRLVPEAPNNSRSGGEDRPGILPPELLLEGYAQGVFPMAESRHDPEVNWYTARRRGIIPLDAFHVSRKVSRIIRRGGYRWSIDVDFRGVMEGCADRETTWISDRIIDSFEVLHELGHAHSVEIYLEDHARKYGVRKDRLVAGIYGVALRSAFFAESMFRTEPEMDKVALFHCHEVLRAGGFQLWDVQFHTPHLAQFGCREMDADAYRQLLAEALRHPARFGAPASR